jgi:hypothetical protein
VILSWIGYELGCLSHVTKYMVYIKIEMSMIKYYHKYILFKCYVTIASKWFWEFVIVVCLKKLGLMLNF